MNAGARHCADINGTFYGQDFSRALRTREGASIDQMHITAMPVQAEPDAPRTPFAEHVPPEQLADLFRLYLTLPRRREAA